MPNAMRPPAPPRPRAPELHTGGDPGGPPEQLDVLVFPKDVQGYPSPKSPPVNASRAPEALDSDL